MAENGIVFYPETPFVENIVLKRSKLDFSDTPVGDTDSHPKIQLCLELREKDLNASSKRVSKGKPVLEVTLLTVKNIPETNETESKAKTAFVVLRLNETMFTTVIKDKTEANCVEVFQFPAEHLIKQMKERKPSIANSNTANTTLQIEVCSQRQTRNSPCLGKVEIDLSELTMGQVKCQWYGLNNDNTS